MHEGHEHSAHSHPEHDRQHSMNSRSMAISATLHCITGCSIGEIAGLVIGTIIGLSTAANIALAIGLSFVFGYALSMLPLLKHGLSFKKALSIILVADTLSILTMEIVDNTVMALIPNAMNANLVNPLYWIAMPVSLIAAFFAAVPVNKYLLERGQGHALVHEYNSQ
jgi:hypothetical protein